MPLYEYRCTQCSTLTDIRHGFDETHSETCASCGGALVKNFNVGGIVFKGSGFYVNDSRGGSNTGESKSGGDSAPAKESPAPAKSDSSPAA